MVIRVSLVVIVISFSIVTRGIQRERIVEEEGNRERSEVKEKGVYS
jgi:hypothetical protein